MRKLESYLQFHNKLNMNYPVNFTHLGFQLNSLLDTGIFISLKSIQQKIDNKEALTYLSNNYSDFDISLYIDKEIKYFESYFNDLYSVIDESRKFGINQNGLCLLVAYCFQALQNKTGIK